MRLFYDRPLACKVLTPAYPGDLKRSPGPQTSRFVRYSRRTMSITGSQPHRSRNLYRRTCGARLGVT